MDCVRYSCVLNLSRLWYMFSSDHMSTNKKKIRDYETKEHIWLRSLYAHFVQKCPEKNSTLIDEWILVLNKWIGFSNLLGCERGPEIYEVSDENMDWTNYTVFSYKFQHWINPQCSPNRMHLRVRYNNG